MEINTIGSRQTRCIPGNFRSMQGENGAQYIHGYFAVFNSDYQITQIAEILGFESLSHFLRIFKEEYRMTPKEYRKFRQGEK